MCRHCSARTRRDRAMRASNEAAAAAAAATSRDGASARRTTTTTTATTATTTATTGTVDESKGLRLLRACGYRGRGGLGKREDGAVEPVRVRVKRDRRGVGDPRAETYEVVGEESETPTSKAREDAKRRRTRADDADDANEAERMRDDTQKMAHIRARAEANRRREKEVTRAMFRAFKSADVEADANPLLRALRVDGGMSRTNPLRRSRG